MSQDLQALREYITAKDGTEYETLPDGLVCLHITHSNLVMQMVDIRLELSSTIEDMRHKVYRHCGTKPDTMDLYLMKPDGSVMVKLDDNTKMLGYYGVHSGMRLHVVDTDPFSLSKSGGLEDVSLVKKYEISEEDYNRREKSVRAYKKEQLAKDPNWKPKHLQQNKPVPGPESVQGMKIGDRCEVQPGARRGTIKYLGEASEICDGYWVGVQFDEPVGKGSGALKGNTYFECLPKYGGFIRPQNVTVGDFPVVDPFEDDEESDDEL